MDDIGKIGDDIAGLIAKWDNLSISEVKQLFARLDETIIKSASIKQWGAKTANQNFKLEYITEYVDFEKYVPPYKVGTFADEINLAEDALFVRLHYGKNEVGRWMMTIEDYKKLMGDMEKLKDVYALPAVPTKASLVKVPKSVTIWKGQAAGNKWGQGGGLQIQIEGFSNYSKEAIYWFKQIIN
ncbi:hypothetical protein [Flagellimonas crocea]|uniref:hypothetical protein n=1 Tax=Flagellimonas crocea TaxID=3067311 RepID=UPI00296ED18D|nr:hypothetical protein [Muricauda sp. DH64]